MVLRLYQNVGLTTMTSRRGRFAYADTVTGAGSYPETIEEAFWIAMERNWLDGAMDDEQKIIQLDYPRFTSTVHPLIRCESEIMLITDGFGTKSLTVTRAQNDTSAAAHVDGTAVYANYDSQGGTLQAVDTAGGSLAGWVEYKLDGGSYASTVTMAALAYNASAKYWRKVIIPADTLAEWDDDLVDRIANVTIDEAA